jgi:TolB-like protein
MRYSFDDIEFDTVTLELRKAGIAQNVEPLILDLLSVLIENRQRIMTKDDLVKVVWKGRIVSDSTIASSIKMVRKAVGDDGKKQRLIRTVNRRGYRFIGELKPQNTTEKTEPALVSVAQRLHKDKEALSNQPDGRPSIAVLPFEMRVGFERFPMLSEAIAHDISRGLSRLRWLRVIATASAFKFRGTQAMVDSASQALQSRYFLTGAVETRGDVLLLDVELIDSSDMNIVWAESIEGSVYEVENLRAVVTGKIIGMVEIQIPLNEATVARMHSPDNLDAWAAFYLGLVNVNRFTQEGTAKSISLFQKAIQLEPGFARAHAALSFAHFQQVFNRYSDVDVHNSSRLAASFAERSLELDELDPYCNFVRGRVSWLFNEVEHSFAWLDRSTHINPNFAQGFYSRALAAVLTGTPYDVHGASRRASSLSPLDPMMYGFQGIRAFEYMATQDYDSAKTWANKSASNPYALVVMDLVAVAANKLAGDEQAAARWAKRARERRPDINQDMFFHALPFNNSTLRHTLSDSLNSFGF